jgi:hypothetical protein
MPPAPDRRLFRVPRAARNCAEAAGAIPEMVRALEQALALAGA